MLCSLEHEHGTKSPRHCTRPQQSGSQKGHWSSCEGWLNMSINLPRCVVQASTPLSTLLAKSYRSLILTFIEYLTPIMLGLFTRCLLNRLIHSRLLCRARPNWQRNNNWCFDISRTSVLIQRTCVSIMSSCKMYECILHLFHLFHLSIRWASPCNNPRWKSDTPNVALTIIPLTTVFHLQYRFCLLWHLHLCNAGFGSTDLLCQIGRIYLKQWNRNWSKHGHEVVTLTFVEFKCHYLNLKKYPIVIVE